MCNNCIHKPVCSKFIATGGRVKDCEHFQDAITSSNAFNMSNINIEMLKEKLYPVAKALFIIGETLVDVSKMHISAEDAINKIRSYMYDTDVIGSGLRVDMLIDYCMEPIVYNNIEEQDVDYLKQVLLEQPIQIFDINGCDVSFESCCDGCLNNPKNGGSGICHCTLPYMQNPTTYDLNTDVDDCCMACNLDGKIFTANKDFLDRVSNMNHSDISASIERIKKYIKV